MELIPNLFFSDFWVYLGYLGNPGFRIVSICCRYVDYVIGFSNIADMYIMLSIFEYRRFVDCIVYFFGYRLCVDRFSTNRIFGPVNLMNRPVLSRF